MRIAKKVVKRLVPCLSAAMCLCGIAPAQAGGSTRPAPPPVAYCNSVSFDPASNVYRFFYTGADGTLEYEYAPAADGSLHSLRGKINGTYVFRPSNVGGLSLWAGGTELFPWSVGVTFTLLEVQTNANTLRTRWRMASGTNQLTYDYGSQISGRTLNIQVTSTNTNSGGLYLDRCEDATNPVVIRVPCLPTMNLLHASGVFASLFVDWETTSASTIHPLDAVYSATSVYYAQQARYRARTDGWRPC